MKYVSWVDLATPPPPHLGMPSGQGSSDDTPPSPSSWTPLESENVLSLAEQRSKFLSGLAQRPGRKCHWLMNSAPTTLSAWCPPAFFPSLAAAPNPQMPGLFSPCREAMPWAMTLWPIGSRKRDDIVSWYFAIRNDSEMRSSRHKQFTEVIWKFQASQVASLEQPALTSLWLSFHICEVGRNGFRFAKSVGKVGSTAQCSPLLE